MIMDKITLNEAGRLLVLERIVTEHKGGFIKAGLALEEIRDKKLYRAKYGTFEDYCTKKWGFGRSYGYRLIEDAKVAAEMSTVSGQIPTAHAAHALSKVPAGQRAAVVHSAKASGAVTSGTIAKAAKPDIELDCTEAHYPVPKGIATTLWNRRDEIQTLLTKVSQVKSALTHAQENKDLLFSEVNFSGAIAYLDNARGNIKRAMPYAVCPTCQGKLVEKCALCSGRGVISEILYSRVDEETKKLRLKAMKK